MPLMPTRAEHRVVHRDRYSYLAHPQVIVKRDKAMVMVFNRAPRREQIMHPPQDPMYMNVVSRSDDDGLTWSSPEVVPDYGWTGTETASLTELQDGTVMLNQWRGRWMPLGLARAQASQDGFSFPQSMMKSWIQGLEFSNLNSFKEGPVAELEAIAPWARAGGQTFVHFSSDGAASFTRSVEIQTAPLIGGYGNRGGVVFPSGKIILPLSDVYNFATVFVVESADNGETWSEPRIVAQADGSEFEEPAPFVTKSGKLVLVLRDNGRRLLHQTESWDEGRTWTPLRQLPIKGYPAHLLQLADGRVLMTYGWRLPDYGIHAVWSDDECATWTTEPIHIRNGMKNANLGYPVTVPCKDGSLLTTYYGEEDDGVTSIMSTRWQMPD